jgi:DNA-binding NarL/FixJ family response regulator
MLLAMPPSAQSRILVAIVDDHEMVRMSLALALEAYDDIEIICEAANGTEAVTVCAQKQPDVVLMDYLMPQMNGVEAARLLSQQYPEIRIILLTATIETELVQQAYTAGVACFARKGPSLDLYDVIQRVYETGQCD